MTQRLPSAQRCRFRTATVPRAVFGVGRPRALRRTAVAEFSVCDCAGDAVASATLLQSLQSLRLLRLLRDGADCVTFTASSLLQGAHGRRCLHQRQSLSATSTSTSTSTERCCRRPSSSLSASDGRLTHAGLVHLRARLLPALDCSASVAVDRRGCCRASAPRGSGRAASPSLPPSASVRFGSVRCRCAATSSPRRSRARRSTSRRCFRSTSCGPRSVPWSGTTLLRSASEAHQRRPLLPRDRPH